MGSAEWMEKEFPGIEEEAWRCGECGGTGVVIHKEWTSVYGLGTLIESPCPRCNGTGWLAEPRVAG